MFAAIQKKLISKLPFSDDQILSALDFTSVESLRHSRNRSLADHLSGTRRILAAWEQPPFIQMAGLCHSIYSTEAFKPQAVPLTDRGRVEKLIGFKAERLAYLFSAVLRRPLFDSIRVATSLRSSDKVPITVRPGLDGVESEISGAEAAQLLLIHLANLAEQSSDEKGRPTMWVAYFTYLARNLSRSDEHAPPVFDSCLKGISRETEQTLRSAYSRGTIDGVASPQNAFENFSRCIHLCSEIPEPHIWLSYLGVVAGRKSEAVNSARTALDLLNRWGTSWDKRLEFTEWRTMAHSLAKGSLSNVPELMSKISYSEREGGIVTVAESQQPESSTTPYRAGVDRFLTYLDFIAKDKSKASVCLYPGLSSKEVHEPSDFTVVPDLETSFDEIRQEVDRIDVAMFHTEAEKINREGSWKVFMLYEGGRKIIENCRQCPTIVNILDRHSCVRKSGGLIYLSRLAPATHVAAHRGPTNLRVRCHFPLQVPTGDCGMRVGQKTLGWELGKCIVFDDHFEHEVWNRTDESRVVLLIDLWHPDLTQEERNALAALQWYAHQQGLGLHRYWRLNEQQRLQESGQFDGNLADILGSLEEGVLPVEDH